MVTLGSLRRYKNHYGARHAVGLHADEAHEGFLRFCYANSDDAIREALMRLAGSLPGSR